MKQFKLLLLLIIGALFAVSCGDDAEDDKPTTTSIDVVLDNSDQLQKEIVLKGLTAVETIENNASWVTVTKMKSDESGAAKIMIDIAENTNSEKRIAIVTVKDAKENTVIVNINQPGFAGKMFTQSIEVSGYGEEVSMALIDLTSDIKNIKVDADWFTVETRSISGATHPSVTVKATPNPTEEVREAKAIINDKNGDRLTLTVVQRVKEGVDVEALYNTQSDQPAYSRQR
jgi:hypothetical protein